MSVDTSQGISVGDAVLTFLGDTTNLDQAFDDTEARAQGWAGNVNTAVSGTSDSFSKAGSAATEFGAQAETAGAEAATAATEVGGSMQEARGAITLLGEEIGVRVPRHLQTFIAGMPGVQAAMSAAFAPIAIIALIDFGSKLIDKIQEITGHAAEVSAAWQKVQDDADSAFTHTGDEILAVEAHIDELNNDKLGALQKNLELIDHASLADLSKQIEQIQKDTDDAFTKMQTWWDWVTTMGQGNAGIAAAKSDFDHITQQLQNLLQFGSQNPDPFKNLSSSLDTAKQKVVQLQTAQQSASGEEKAVLQEQIDAENRRILYMQQAHSDLQQEKDDLDQLNAKRAEQQKTVEALASSGSMLASEAAQELAGTEKSIEAKNKDIDALGKYIILQDQSLKLEQDKVTVATTNTAKTDPTKQAEALLAAQKTLGDAMFALMKAQGIEQVDAQESTYSLENAQSKQAYVQQLDLITQAELQKRAIQLKADDDAYQFQLSTLNAQLDLLKKSGKDTSDEQVKLNADIEALHVKHQTTILETYTKAMTSLRAVLSQPIPLINEMPPGMDVIENEVTKNFADAQQAAQSLGITLKSSLDSGFASAQDAYAKLDTLFKQGIITQKDLDNGYKAMLKSELAFAIETGASSDAVKKLEADLKALVQQQIAHERATGASSASIQKLQKELQGLETTEEKAKGVTKDYTSQLQQDLQSGANAWTLFTDEADIAMQGMEASISSAFAAMVSGQESFGEAMLHSTEKMISQMAQQWAEYFAAKGIADIFFDPALGAAELAAAAALEAISGVLSGLSSATKSTAASTSSGTKAPATTSPAVNAAPAPTQTVNTTHFATGAVISQQTLAMLGDGPHGGNATEAVLPLEDKRALEQIADALIPALLMALSKNSPGNQDVAYQSIPSLPNIGVPRFFDGGLVSSPLLAMLGDSRDGGAANEGVLPLDNSAAMSKIASAIVSQLLTVPLPATPRYESSASSALLPASILASVASAIEHESRISVGSGSSVAGESSFVKIAEDLARTSSELRTTSAKPQQISIKLEADIPHTVKLIAPEMSRQVKNGNVRLHSSTTSKTIKQA